MSSTDLMYGNHAHIVLAFLTGCCWRDELLEALVKYCVTSSQTPNHTTIILFQIKRQMLLTAGHVE